MHLRDNYTVITTIDLISCDKTRKIYFCFFVPLSWSHIKHIKERAAHFPDFPFLFLFFPLCFLLFLALLCSVQWILKVLQSDTRVGLSFCPTQIRVHASRPLQDELLLAFCLLFICLKNLLNGPPRRCLFLLGRTCCDPDELALVAWVGGVTVVMLVEFFEARKE